jgi:hypothetical protein
MLAAAAPSRQQHIYYIDFKAFGTRGSYVIIVICARPLLFLNKSLILALFTFNS